MVRTYRATEIYSDDLRRLLLIESIEWSHASAATCFQVSGIVKPVAVLVQVGDAVHGVDMLGQQVNPEALREKSPELDRLIAAAMS